MRPATLFSPDNAVSSRVSGIAGAASLALLAYIGQLKANPIFDWSPVDLTIAVAALVMMLAIWSRVQHGPAHRTIAAPVLLMTVFLLGLIGSPFDGYASVKVLTLYTVTLVCFVAPFYLLRTGVQRRVFIYALIAIGVIVSLVLFLWPENIQGSSAIQFPGTNTIGTARIVAAGAVAAVIVAVAARGRRRFLYVACAAILIPATLVTGNRAALLALAVSLVVVLLAAPIFRKIRVRSIVAVSGALVIVAIWQIFSGTNGERLLRLFLGSADSSVSARWYFWGESISHLQWAPWGIGWGAFPHILEVNSGANLYPHNLLLEVFLEAGWIPGVMLLALVVWAVGRMLRGSNNMVSAALFGLLVFTVLNALISGDVNANRLMWMLLACGLMGIQPLMVIDWLKTLVRRIRARRGNTDAPIAIPRRKF